MNLLKNIGRGLEIVVELADLANAKTGYQLAALGDEILTPRHPDFIIYLGLIDDTLKALYTHQEIQPQRRDAGEFHAHDFGSVGIDPHLALHIAGDLIVFGSMAKRLCFRFEGIDNGVRSVDVFPLQGFEFRFEDDVGEYKRVSGLGTGIFLGFAFIHLQLVFDLLLLMFEVLLGNRLAVVADVQRKDFVGCRRDVVSVCVLAVHRPLFIERVGRGLVSEGVFLDQSLHIVLVARDTGDQGVRIRKRLLGGRRRRVLRKQRRAQNSSESNFNYNNDYDQGDESVASSGRGVCACVSR